MLRIVLMVFAMMLLAGCAFHSTARDWNGLLGEDEKPAYYKTTTKVAFNLLVIIPFLGDDSIDGLVEDLTEDIKEEKGNRVRIVQGSTENYWYGFPPFTWFVTPVVSTVAAEYRPDKETYFKEQEEIRQDEGTDTGLNPLKW